MKARYIIVSILSWLGLAAQAQSLELKGIVASPDGGLSGRMILVKADGGSVGFNDLELVCFSLRDASYTKLQNGYKHLVDDYYLLPIPSDLDRNFDVPLLDTADRYAYRVRLVLSDGNVVISEIIEDNGVERFQWIGQDVKWNAATTGYKNVVFDEGVEGQIPLMVDDIGFNKSFSAHARGSFTFNFAADSPYSRLFTYYGIQQDRTAGRVNFVLNVNGVDEESNIMYAKNNTSNKPADYSGPYLRKYDVPIEGETTILLKGEIVSGNNSGAHMNYLMGRLYLKHGDYKTQEAQWPDSVILAYNKPFTYELDARFTSGEKALYFITSGSEYASIKDGNVLDVHTIPTDRYDYIEVAAIQPGTADYLISPLSVCRFYVRNDKTVAKDGKLVLNDGDEIDQLTVYADPESRGQVVVDKGFVTVKKLILKYTFNPGEWNFISFPANVSLSKISDLNSLGYSLNDSKKAFYICEYSTRSRAEQPSKTAWVKMQTDNVVKNKGYIMGVARSADNPDNKPVEVTFVFENTTLGMDASNNGSLNVELNMMQVEPGAEIPVYVKPDGVKGAPLRVMVRFSPKDVTELPVNYANALEEARVTFNPNNSGIRLTLPTQDPAKVVIFDSKERVVKAVKYIAPYLIDVTDMKPGKYQLYIQYGNATATKPFEIGENK